jgi:hypothetical protein
VVSASALIDDLYKKPLDEFVAARNALAKTRSGDEAAHIKRLAKPTAVPWAINQVYWHDRATYDQLLDRGKQLRTAQLAALRGRAADVQAATDAHRKALAAAAKSAARFAERARSRPNLEHANLDQLMRTLEALSLAAEPPEPHGRLTHVLAPAGFEALAGVSPAARSIPHASLPGGAGHGRTANADEARRAAEAVAARRARDAERLAARKARDQEVAASRARAALERARAAEIRARTAWERARQDVEAAERRLSMATKSSIRG